MAVPVPLIATVAFGVLAIGFALFAIFETPKRISYDDRRRRPSPKRGRSPSPPTFWSKPPNKPSPPPPVRGRQSIRSPPPPVRGRQSIRSPPYDRSPTPAPVESRPRKRLGGSTPPSDHGSPSPPVTSPAPVQGRLSSSLPPSDRGSPSPPPSAAIPSSDQGRQSPCSPPEPLVNDALPKVDTGSVATAASPKVHAASNDTVSPKNVVSSNATASPKDDAASEDTASPKVDAALEDTASSKVDAASNATASPKVDVTLNSASPRPVSPAFSDSSISVSGWSVTSENACYRSDHCENCDGIIVDLVEFIPCGGSFFCRKCALNYLSIGKHCCKCGEVVTSMKFK